MRALVEGLSPSAVTSSGMRLALVSSNAEGRRICRIVKRLVSAGGYPVTAEVFLNRASALDWLGVMHVPVGGAAPATRS